MALSDLISKANDYIQSYAQKAQNYISDYGWGSGNTWNYSSGGGSSSSSPSIKSGLQSSGGSSYSTGKSYSGKSIGDLLLPTAEVTVNTNPDTSSDGWFYADTNTGSNKSDNDGWNYASYGGGSSYGGSANEPSQSSYSGGYSPSPSVKIGLKSTQQTPAPQQNLPEAIVEPVSNSTPTVSQQTANLRNSLLSQSAAEDNSVMKQKSPLPGLDTIFDENAIQRDIRRIMNDEVPNPDLSRSRGSIGRDKAYYNWAWKQNPNPYDRPTFLEKVNSYKRAMEFEGPGYSLPNNNNLQYSNGQERLNPSISEFDEQQARRQALQQLPPLSNADAMRFGVQNTIANSERPNLTIDDAINFMRNDLGISGVNDFGIAGLEPEAERAYALQLLEDGVVPENPQPDFWQNLINNVSNSLGSFGNTESQKAITESAQTTAENRGSNGNYPVHEKSDLEKRIIEGLYNKTYPNIIAAAKNTWYDWQNFGKKTDAYNQYKENYLNSIGKSEVELTNAERKQLDIDANAYAEQQYPSTHTTPRQEQKNLAAIIEQREQSNNQTSGISSNKDRSSEIALHLTNQGFAPDTAKYIGDYSVQNNMDYNDVIKMLSLQQMGYTPGQIPNLMNQVDQNGVLSTSVTPPLNNLIADVKSGKYGYKMQTDDGGYLAMPPNPQEVLANFGGKSEGNYYDFRAPDSGLVINDDFSDIIASDRFSSAQNIAIPGYKVEGKTKGASIDDLTLSETLSSYPQNVETVEMTEKEFNAKFDKFLNANPDLQSLIDSGAVTRSDVAAYFCKNIKVVKEEDTNKKSYGGGGGYGYGGGGVRTLRFGGGGGGGGSYSSSSGSSGSGSSSSSKTQSTSRIHNIMKNWTF